MVLTMTRVETTNDLTEQLHSYSFLKIWGIPHQIIHLTRTLITINKHFQVEWIEIILSSQFPKIVIKATKINNSHHNQLPIIIFLKQPNLQDNTLGGTKKLKMIKSIYKINLKRIECLYNLMQLLHLVASFKIVLLVWCKRRIIVKLNNKQSKLFYNKSKWCRR